MMDSVQRIVSANLQLFDSANRSHTREYKIFLDVKTGEMRATGQRGMKEITIVGSALKIDTKGLDLQAKKVIEVMQKALFLKEVERLPNWIGSATREEVDELLKNSPQGTYVIRPGDDQVDSMSHERENLDPNTVYFLLTYVDKEEKTAERLILKTPKGWIAYNDEPRIEKCPVFNDLGALLQSLKIDG